MTTFIYQIPSDYEKDIILLKFLSKNHDSLFFSLLHQDEAFVTLEVSLANAIQPG